MASLHARIVMAAALVAVAACAYVEQETALTSAVRDTPNGRFSQAFTATRDGQLQSIEVHLGTPEPCRPLEGTLVLREGSSIDWSSNPSQGALATATVQTTCEEAVCQYGNCMRWQSFSIQADLTKGVQYVFGISGLYTPDMLHTAKITVSPALENAGGPSSLVVSPIYATKYAQYTFRTYVDTAPSSGTQFAEEPNNGDGSNNSGGASTAVGVAGIVVPIVIVVVLVAFAAGYVYQRRSKHGNHTVQPETDSMELPSREASTAGGRRRPIHVRSNDVEEFTTWADRVDRRDETFV